MDITSQATTEDLIEDLRVNLKLSEEILSALSEENKALRGMATQDLFRLSKLKTNLLAKVNYLDQALKDRGLSTANPLSMLSNNLPEEQAAIIKQYCHGIKQLRQDIQTQNLINKRFTHDTLACLNEAISLITRPEPTGLSYGTIRRSKQYNTNQPSLISKEV